MNCAACHGTEFTVIPGVTRWSDIYACDNCGTLRVRVDKYGTTEKVESSKEEAGDS